MTINQAVKVSNLLQELEAIDALCGEIERVLAQDPCIPSKLANDIIALVNKAYEDKKKEIEEM
jgi:hypothetical protein